VWEVPSLVPGVSGAQGRPENAFWALTPTTAQMILLVL
jgi:hypothetical protein